MYISPLLLIMENLFSKFLKNELIILFVHYYPVVPNSSQEKVILENLQYLKDNCNVISFNEAIFKLENNFDLPKRSVAIIVDDATKSFYDVGFNLLLASKLPFTLAIIPGLIESDSIEHFLAKLMRIAGHQYYLPHKQMLKLAWEKLGNEINNSITFNDIFMAARILSKEELINLLQILNIPNDKFMTWDELRSVKLTGRVEFASHTMSHPLLKFSTGEWLSWELQRSKELIESNLNLNVNSLILPYGGLENIHQELKTELRNNNYKHSVLTEFGSVSINTSRYLIPRMNGEVNSIHFKAMTSPLITKLFFPFLNSSKNKEERIYNK